MFLNYERRNKVYEAGILIKDLFSRYQLQTQYILLIKDNNKFHFPLFRMASNNSLVALNYQKQNCFKRVLQIAEQSLLSQLVSCEKKTHIQLESMKNISRNRFK